MFAVVIKGSQPLPEILPKKEPEGKKCLGFSATPPL
jgi:hypothetical protein